MLHKYRALFLDLDGTLLNSRQEVSTESLAALEKVARRGAKVVISTGRPIPSIRRLMHYAEFPYAAISLNGTVVHGEAHGSPLSVYPIKPEVVTELSRILASTDAVRNMAFDSIEHWFSNLSGPIPAIFRGMYDTGPRPLPLPFEQRDPILNIVVEMHAGRAELAERLQRTFEHQVALTNYEQYPILEVAPHGRSKGTALRELCTHWQIPLEETIAFGDGENDVEMLAEAGYAVVMDNALPWVKKHAQRIAPSNDEHGVAQVIESLLAITVAQE